MISKRFDFPVMARAFGRDWRHSTPGSSSSQPDVSVVSPSSRRARPDHDPSHGLAAGFHIWIVDEPNRPRLTANVVNSTWPAIILCDPSRSAQAIASQLGHHGAPTTSVHRTQTAQQRRRALTDFTSGHARGLVTSNDLADDLAI